MCSLPRHGLCIERNRNSLRIQDFVTLQLNESSNNSVEVRHASHKKKRMQSQHHAEQLSCNNVLLCPHPHMLKNSPRGFFLSGTCTMMMMMMNCIIMIDQYNTVNVCIMLGLSVCCGCRCKPCDLEYCLLIYVVEHRSML